ncbi:unnamed protein product [Amoebophrya sp. A120]|nr:unnamed protein product [Amoebophrya sp. A120]|eukprot:GSA120T00001958001.1
MAKHGLRGMKKAKFRTVRRDMKTADRKKVQKEKKKHANEQKEKERLANPHGLSAADFQGQAQGQRARTVCSKLSYALWESQCALAGREVENCLLVMTKKSRKEFESKLLKAVRQYNAPGERILLVGEGNFSFARALCTSPFAAPVGSSPPPSSSSGRGGPRDEDVCSDSKTTTSRSESHQQDETERPTVRVVLESVTEEGAAAAEPCSSSTYDDGQVVASTLSSPAAQNENVAEVVVDHRSTLPEAKEHSSGFPEQDLQVQEGRALLVASCYDDKSTLLQKYGEEAKQNVKFLKKQLNTQVCVGVDCRKLSEVFADQKERKFDKIVFQFPHSGTGERDRAKNVQENQEMLQGFFNECVKCLTSKTGEVHVTLKSNDTYKDWKIASCCAKGSNNRLRVRGAYDFDPRCFPGYAHRRTIGFKENLSASANEEILKTGAKTYVFAWTSTSCSSSSSGTDGATAPEIKSGGCSTGATSGEIVEMKPTKGRCGSEKQKKKASTSSKKRKNVEHGKKLMKNRSGKTSGKKRSSGADSD